MQVDVITVMPGLVEQGVGHGVLGRAIESGLLRLRIRNPRDYSDDPNRRVDDRPYGGGPGMVMQAEPLFRAIEAARDGATGRCVLALTPQGQRLDQTLVRELAAQPGLILVCGRYEGMDERVLRSAVDREVSIGDYVLTGGELAALVLIDAVARWVPGVLGHQASAQRDCFTDGLLGWPQYTRPDVVRGQGVPDVLLGGDHGAIDRWRLKQALGRTWLRRPDLLAQRKLTEPQQALLDEFIKDYQGRRSSVDDEAEGESWGTGT